MQAVNHLGNQQYPIQGTNVPLTHLDLIQQLQKDDINSIALLEEMVEKNPLLVQTVLAALKERVEDVNCPKDMADRCVMSFKVLIPSMQKQEILTVVSFVMDILGDETLSFENTFDTLVALINTDVNQIVPVVLEELNEIVINEDEIYVPRDEQTILCAESLLKAISLIIMQNQAQLKLDVWEKITKNLKVVWDEEANRFQNGFGQRCLDPDVVGNAFLELATRRSDDSLCEFLMECAIETAADPKDKNTPVEIPPLIQAALEALLKNHSIKVIERFIDFISEGEIPCNMMWIFGELAYRRGSDISKKDLPIILDSFLNTLNKSPQARRASRAAETLGKMWNILDQNQKNLTLHALCDGCLGKHNIVQVDAVQVASAWGLGEISKTADQHTVDTIIPFLIQRQVDPDYDVRASIANALKNVGEIANSRQLPTIFKALLGSLSDQDAKVQKTAAKALQTLIQNNRDFSIANSRTILETAHTALMMDPKTNPKKKSSARHAISWMVHDVANYTLTQEYQDLIKLINETENENYEDVREAVSKILKLN